MLEKPLAYHSCVGSAGWRVSVYETVGSTNDLARALPGWSAVRAEAQTGGRGRLGRKFHSDAGGLWLSAVLPAPGGPARWSGFSLAAGWQAMEVIRSLGAPLARLRWPNDILVGSRKLAGLLVEQPDPERLIVGIGVNVTNTPWVHDPALEATRLADVVADPPDLDTLGALLLDGFAEAHAAMATGGLVPIIERLNLSWQEKRPVELERRDHEPLRGLFAGLEPTGDLRLADESGGTRVIPHLDVNRLREL